jgi:hypothetical protein
MPRTSDKLVTQAEYARSRKARGLPGGTRKSVHLAVASGRIDAFGPDKLIDPGLADRQWAENTQVRAANDAPTVPAPGGDLVDQAGAAAQTPAVDPDPAAASPTSLATDPTYQDARARQAVADARTAELKLAELEGQLIRVDQVHAAFAGKLAPVREALLQISARVAPLLASQSDSGRIQTILDAEIHQVLAPLSMVTLASEGTGA